MVFWAFGSGKTEEAVEGMRGKVKSSFWCAMVIGCAHIKTGPIALVVVS